GLWDDGQIGPLAHIVDFLHAEGSAAGIQLAHAGRKASTRRPWDGYGIVGPEEGGWTPVGPSAVAFEEGKYLVPQPLTLDEIAKVPGLFADAARRARDAGIEVVEVHSAHGYLLHSFLTPLANRRTDAYGGDLRARARLLLETVEAVRRAFAGPVFVRVSATDWVEGGLGLDEVVQVARWLKEVGADAIDASSGGASPLQKIAVGPGYQVPFAARIRREAGIPTVAVGVITDPAHADAIVREGSSDLVALARELLRDPYWPQRAAKALGVRPDVPPQYLRAH
ncbi:MAG: hypothetical protein ACAI25_12155, partial [Planctomycetota bacterium]